MLLFSLQLSQLIPAMPNEYLGKAFHSGAVMYLNLHFLCFLGLINLLMII